MSVFDKGKPGAVVLSGEMTDFEWELLGALWDLVDKNNPINDYIHDQVWFHSSDHMTQLSFSRQAAAWLAEERMDHLPEAMRFETRCYIAVHGGA